MPVFKEDPAFLSKSRLKSDLVAHNVALPPSKSRKEVYVELHLKHIEQKNAAEFSSDEEVEHAHDAEDNEEDPEDAETLDPSALTDDELKAALLKHGVNAGPIVASTRALYEKKLRNVSQPNGEKCREAAETGVLYSDSEEEEEEEEEEREEEKSEELEEGPVEAKKATIDQSAQTGEGSQNDDFVYPQCFLLSSKLRPRAFRKREPCPKWNSGNAVKSPERSRPLCAQIPAGISRASSVDQHSGLDLGMEKSLSASSVSERELNGSDVHEHWSRSNRPDKNDTGNQSLYYTPMDSSYERPWKPPVEPEKDTFKDMFPDSPVTPTGIYATRRRPIKGAAGRPVQFLYPDTPASPATLERREEESRLVPIYIQVLVFVVMVVLIYLISICVQDNSFGQFAALLDSLSQGLQAETQEALGLPGQE